MWRSLVARFVRDEEVVGSNPATPTQWSIGPQRADPVVRPGGRPGTLPIEVTVPRRGIRATVKRIPVVGPAARRAAAARTSAEADPEELDEETSVPGSHDSAPADRYGYVFVVTHGRSGSTLLNGILNSIPGYLIRGENQGYLHDLFRAHRGAVSRRRALRKDSPTTPQHPWFGIEDYPPRLAVTRMQALVLDTVLRPEPDSRVLGFKEIRYGQPDVVDYLGFIRTLFPGARFVFNSRDPAGVLKSDWWADRDPADLTTIRERLAEAEQAHREVSYHVHYDDYRDAPEQLEGLFGFLGEPFDVDAVRAVMAVPHSY